MLRDRTDRTWFSRLLRHPARKWSGSILTAPEHARGLGMKRKKNGKKYVCRQTDRWRRSSAEPLPGNVAATASNTTSLVSDDVLVLMLHASWFISFNVASVTAAHSSYHFTLLISGYHFLQLAGRQDGQPACKKLGVCWWWLFNWRELCMTYNSSCHHHLLHP